MKKINLSTKGSAQMWWIIMAAVLALVVVILVLVWFRGTGDKIQTNVGGQIDDLGDEDKDRVANLFDKCPCDADVGTEFTEQKKTKAACVQCK